jgi:hypothetical protein
VLEVADGVLETAHRVREKARAVTRNPHGLLQTAQRRLEKPWRWP